MKIIVVQPYLTKYRLPVFEVLKARFDLKVMASRDVSYGHFSSTDLSSIGFESIREIKFLSGRLTWQSGILLALFKFKPDVVFMSANPRQISLWLALVVSKILRIKVILHGQGLYNKNCTLFYKLQYALFSMLSDRYICYTESCRESLKATLIYEKSIVAENSIVNNSPLKKMTVNDFGVLFVGRLRDGCNLDLLIDSMIAVRAAGYPVHLHVVGGGDENYKVKYKKLSFVHFYGEIYNPKKITDIAMSCFAGCYPGDAGLSVLHYMSLSLPPIVHSDLKSHMGPEPSYILDGINGVLFERDSLSSLVEAIEGVLSDNVLLKSLKINSFETYSRLTTPSLGERFSKIIDEVGGT